MPDPVKALENFYDVLKKGLLILTTPTLKGDWIHDSTHICVRPPKFWREILEKVGFRVQLYYAPVLIGLFPGTPKPLRVILSSLPIRYQFFIEEPLRKTAGLYYAMRERLYLFAIKS